MPYKNLLVHIDDSKSNAKRLEAAFSLALTHDAHLTGLYVAPDPELPSNLRAEVPPELLRTMWEHVEERVANAKERFLKEMEKAGVRSEVRALHCPASRMPEVVTLHGRYTDLVILGQPEPDSNGDVDPDAVEDVVLSVGRPALVIPYIGAGETLGERIVVAWDGGREAARAVNDAIPLLERAKHVVVLVIDPHKGGHGEEPGADIALHLARHGIEVEAEHIGAGDLSVADALLSRLTDREADLLVMGAYGHSRLREWVLGGTTRQIFKQMTVPVLMSH
ncbi:MAG: universal stress protein [Alphaproteobacteria bacterium]|nr:MAG: universal stress protein [Alphaproteobacteria bacterium]